MSQITLESVTLLTSDILVFSVSKKISQCKRRQQFLQQVAQAIQCTIRVGRIELTELNFAQFGSFYSCFRVEQSAELPSIVTDVDLPTTTIDKVPLTIHTGTM